MKPDYVFSKKAYTYMHAYVVYAYTTVWTWKCRESREKEVYVEVVICSVHMFVRVYAYIIGSMRKGNRAHAGQLIPTTTFLLIKSEYMPMRLERDKLIFIFVAAYSIYLCVVNLEKFTALHLLYSLYLFVVICGLQGKF